MRRLILILAMALGVVAAPAFASDVYGCYGPITSTLNVGWTGWGASCSACGEAHYSGTVGVGEQCVYNGYVSIVTKYSSCPTGQQQKPGTNTCQPITCPTGQVLSGSTCVAVPTCTSSQYLDAATNICKDNPVCTSPQTLNPITHQCTIDCAATAGVKVGSSSDSLSGSGNLCLSGCQFSSSMSLCGAGGVCSQGGPFIGVGSSCTGSEIGGAAAASPPSQLPTDSASVAAAAQSSLAAANNKPPVTCLPGSVWSSTANNCIPSNSTTTTTTSANNLTTTEVVDCSSGTCVTHEVTKNADGVTVGDHTSTDTSIDAYCRSHPTVLICSASENSDPNTQQRNGTAGASKSLLDSIASGSDWAPNLGLSNWSHQLTDFVPNDYECTDWDLSFSGKEVVIHQCAMAAKLRSIFEYCLAFLSAIVLWNMLTRKEDGEK